MAAPFDDQLILDLPQTGTYTSPAGSSVSVAGVTVQETGVTPIQVGLFSLVSRDARIAIGMSQFTGRPAEGGRYAATDGIIWQFVSVVKRELANFWDITGRTFNVPDGLTETAMLYRRNSTPTTTAGLNNPTWAALESNVAAKLMIDAQAVDFGEPKVETQIDGHLLINGFREMRAGDRVALASAPSVYWDVEGSEPYDPTLGVQILRLSKRK